MQAVLDALGQDAVDLVGYSMGAITAARLLGIESRLRAVALCGTGLEHVEGHGEELFDRLRGVGRCFQSDGWANHPEYTPYRANTWTSITDPNVTNPSLHFVAFDGRMITWWRSPSELCPSA